MNKIRKSDSKKGINQIESLKTAAPSPESFRESNETSLVEANSTIGTKRSKKSRPSKFIVGNSSLK